MFSWMRSSLVVGILALIATGQMWGQGMGALKGTVTDPTGAVVPGAKVKLTALGTAATRVSTTATDGGYFFAQLLPGDYRIEVTAPGFKTAARAQVSVQVGSTAAVDLKLEVGSATETVEVKEAASAINTQDASLGASFGERAILQLPLEARNIVGLLSLQTGATYLPIASDDRSGSIQGSRSDQTTISLDGVRIDDPENELAAYQTVLRVTPDSVQEFRTTTGNYGSDLGGSSGAQVQLVTKSGTNAVHGSVYEYLRNTATSSNEYFNKLAGLKTPELNKNIFGASAGGPIIKNRLFVFANYEGLREVEGTPSLQTLPSNSMRDGVIIYQCADAALCPGGTVAGVTGTHSVAPGFFGLTPAQFAAIDPLGIGPNPAVLEYFNLYPHANAPGIDGLNIMGFRFTAPTRTTLNTAITRVDWIAASKHTLFWRGNLQDDSVNSAPQFPGQPPNTTTRNLSKGMMLGYQALLTNTVVNSFRWGFTRSQTMSVGLLSQPQVTFRRISDLFARTPTSYEAEPTHELRDDITWTKGAHALQFGGDVRFVRIPRFSNQNSFSSVEVDPDWLQGVGENYMPGYATCTTPGCTAVPAVAGSFAGVWSKTSVNLWGLLNHGFADYNYTRNGTALNVGEAVKRRYADDSYQWYFQDQWRIRPSLVLTYGLRYTLVSPPWETGGNQVAPSPGMNELYNERRSGMFEGIPSNAYPNIVFNLAGPANGRPGFYPWDKHNFAPRAALAWSPSFTKGLLERLFGDHKTVIRGGYSIVYDQIGEALAKQFDTSGGSYGLSASLGGPFGGVNESTSPRFTGPYSLPGPPIIPAAPAGGFPAIPAYGAGNVSNTIDDGIVTPYSHLLNFTIGRDLPHNYSVEASYVARLGRNLLTKIDYAMPLDLVDPTSHMDLYTAGTMLAKLAEVGDPRGISVGTNTNLVQPIPYFEDMFPGAAGKPPFNIYGVGAASTATQVVYDTYLGYHGDYGDALLFLDTSPTLHSKLGEYAYYLNQFCCYFGAKTFGSSDYESFQLHLRKRFSHGLQFDFNYTLAKSLDDTSDVQRSSASYCAASGCGNLTTGGVTSVALDSWYPHKSYSYSDFDVLHNFNVNWVYEFPFGSGKRLGANSHGWANQIVGGWQVSGLFRLTSGFPFNILSCGSCFTTNDGLVNNAVLLTPTTKLPETKVTKSGGTVNAFADPTDALSDFKPGRPGEIGLRNALRGDGYFTIDTGVGKAFPIGERSRLQFRWETFNLTNTPKFSTSGLSAEIDESPTFGQYNQTYATCDQVAGRCMQFSLRYEF